MKANPRFTCQRLFRHDPVRDHPVRKTAFLNLRVLIALFIVLAGVFLPFIATAQEAWVARYKGPGGANDFPYAVAVDGSGNVYVTGSSVGQGTGLDYATIKYNSSGQQQWVARYNGRANGDDYGQAVAVDGSGNVYVTGYSAGSGTGYDIATIKYNASGVQQWVARYDGPASGNDYAFAIALDSSGNVCVTGESSGIGTGFDYVTIKYNSSGQQKWVARYNGPVNGDDSAQGIAVDASGNVYVTGESQGLGDSCFPAPCPDYATIKYNASGQQQWVARYNGPANGDDVASAIAVDSSGNVYVTGGSTRSSGSGYQDYATIKYDTSGTQQWVARYTASPTSSEYAYAIAVDGSGNVYVTGQSGPNEELLDYATVAYNSSGQQKWVARYNGTGNSTDVARAIAVDGSSNVFVTGYSIGSGTGYDIATIKYNSLGTQQWVDRYNGPGNGDDGPNGPYAIAVDTTGNAYVTGQSFGDSGNYDYATIKYYGCWPACTTPNR